MDAGEAQGPDRDVELAVRVAKAAPGIDAGAEAELAARLAPRVRLYGLRHLRDSHAAADLVQQVLLLTLEKLRGGELRDHARIVSFVFGACRMMVLELRRGTARRERLLEQFGMVEEAVEADLDAPLYKGRVADCLEALGERERSVVLLTFCQDKSADEVAGELGLTAGNVRVIRHRSIARLRDCVVGTVEHGHG
jgi:RNA polymerase sigma-70 factor (ECF subfamily)